MGGAVFWLIDARIIWRIPIASRSTAQAISMRSIDDARAESPALPCAKREASIRGLPEKLGAAQTKLQ
jgi:hypothetical protein